MFPICVLIPLLTYSVSNPEFAASFESAQGRNEGVQGGGTIPGRRITAGAPKSLNNIASTFFNAVYLLPKDLRFEHGGAKLVSCRGRHLTSVRP